jgi:hypothetical protein
VSALRNYTRWVQDDAGLLLADILGAGVDIAADPAAGKVLLNGQAVTPDEARLIGVRLIDAAVLADGPRAIRRAPGAPGEHPNPNRRDGAATGARLGVVS